MKRNIETTHRYTYTNNVYKLYRPKSTSNQLCTYKNQKENLCMKRNEKRYDVWQEMERELMYEKKYKDDWCTYENKYKDNLCMESNKR